MGTLSDWWGSWRARYEALVEEYGWVAIATYFTIFFGTWFGFWVAIRSGYEPGGAAASAGTVGGAYVATKLTQPLRIGITLVLLPAVVRVKRAVLARLRPELSGPS